MIPEIMHLPMNPNLVGQAEVKQHIVYSENGQELTLILPWAKNDDYSKGPRRPLILFVQGSAWTTPNLDYEIPMLSHFAEEGLIVATVSHRSAQNGFVFPAFLQDVKCAIRFLRANADTYSIDPQRIAAFGTSSGGNTVCLLGLTGDDPELKTAEYAEQSDAVCAVAACFAPTDLPALFDHLKASPDIGFRHGQGKMARGHAPLEPGLPCGGRKTVSALPAAARHGRSPGALRSVGRAVYPPPGSGRGSERLLCGRRRARG